jgi:hypothetical protein
MPPEISSVFEQRGVVVLRETESLLTLRWSERDSNRWSRPRFYGSETGPGPQLATWGKSAILTVDAHGFRFDYTLTVRLGWT